MLSIAVSPERVEADLAAGTLACPDCGGRLTPWGHARSRQVRMLDGVRSFTPRRACCRGCATTHVLCPSWSVPRRRDAAEVIGQALSDAARGEGHRPIAMRLGRPPATVRGWLRAARARAGILRASGTRWLYALDPEVAPVTPAGSELGDAIEAVVLAARALVLRFGQTSSSPWELAVSLTGGLLSGRPPLPP
jgi:hypothetical protein